MARDLGFKALDKILLKKLFIGNPDVFPLNPVSMGQDRDYSLLIGSPAYAREEKQIQNHNTSKNRNQTNRMNEIQIQQTNESISTKPNGVNRIQSIPLKAVLRASASTLGEGTS